MYVKFNVNHNSYLKTSVKKFQMKEPLEKSVVIYIQAILCKSHSFSIIQRSFLSRQLPHRVVARQAHCEVHFPLVQNM